MVYDYPLVEALAAPVTVYFRPTTMAFGTTTFSFYADSFFTNVIMTMYTYFDLVKYEMLEVTYTPPVHLSGSAWNGVPPI
jgi:hypothetical protein